MIELYKIDDYFFDDEKFTEYIKQKYGTHIPMRDRGRMLATPISKSNIDYYQKHGKSATHLIMSMTGFIMISESPTFYMHPTYTLQDNIVCGGSFMDIDVFYYIDVSNADFIDEKYYFLGDNIFNVNQYMIQRNRLKKLSRVLK